MLLKYSKSESYWCFDESDKIYWHKDTIVLNNYLSGWHTARRVAEGQNILLGPVCLGFWRG